MLRSSVEDNPGPGTYSPEKFNKTMLPPSKVAKRNSNNKVTEIPSKYLKN